MIKKSKKNIGFTLIEVMLTVSLSIVIFFIVYDLYLLSQKSFNTSNTKMELLQNGRIIIDRITREIRQSQDIVTPLPESKGVEGFDPPTEFQFQDGHGVPDIQYLRYYLSGTDLYRQRITYYFSEEPGTFVYWDAVDQFLEPPESIVTDNKIIAEYISNIAFYGEDFTNIEVWLTKNNINEHIYSSVWGRNSRE